MNKRKIINWVLLLIWMAFIAMMSNKPANISDSYSMGIISDLESLGFQLYSFFGEKTNFVIRKGAHFIEYMILAMLIYNVYKLYLYKNKVVIITIICTTFYACLDEFHQLFIEGRQGSFRDVIIDTAGGITAIIMRILYNRFSKRR